jgi:hypothetical protein
MSNRSMAQNVLFLFEFYLLSIIILEDCQRRKDKISEVMEAHSHCGLEGRASPVDLAGS